jgi:hypothetical protein
LLLICRDTGHGSSGAPRNQNELNESVSIFPRVATGTSYCPAAYSKCRAHAVRYRTYRIAFNPRYQYFGER